MSDPHGHPGEAVPDARVPDEHGSSHAVEGPHGATADHGGEGHGHDDHGHLDEPLGSIDWPMWGVGVLGVAVALAMAAAFAIATDLVAVG